MHVLLRRSPDPLTALVLPLSLSLPIKPAAKLRKLAPGVLVNLSSTAVPLSHQFR